VNSVINIRFTSILVLLLTCRGLFAQTTTPLNAAQIFHVHGVIHSPYNDSLVSAIKIQFVGENIAKTVLTHRKGF